MESHQKTLSTTEAQQHLAMKKNSSGQGLRFVLLLSCILLLVATWGPCGAKNHIVAEMVDQVGDSFDTCARDLLGGYISAEHHKINSATCSSIEKFCVNSKVFCFPSTLPVFSAEVDNSKAASVEGQSNSCWSSDDWMCSLYKGMPVMSCSLTDETELCDVGTKADQQAWSLKGPSPKCSMPYVIPDKNFEVMKSDLHDALSSPNIKLKALEGAEADELVLRNWRFQGTTSGMSVLEEEEVLFPVVQIGNHHSKWISVKNPSAQPVIMQLILNSRETIEACKAADMLPLSSSVVHDDSTRPARYGFSTAASAITEVYVHPNGRAFLGPVVFHPSERCAWRGSAVIRNNLSGVEWLSLKGFGGSLSLVLLDGFQAVHSLEFNLSIEKPFDLSYPEKLYHSVVKSPACSKPLSKVIFAKNSGDLPLKIKSIEVSGAGCGLDGFKVHTCDSFSLEPGELRKLLISYQPDFYAGVVHGDLELALATGIFVIPMKASIPVYMLSICRKSIIWILLKKFAQLVFIVASILFFLFFFVLPQVITSDPSDCLFKTENACISRVRGPYCIHPNHGKCRFSISCYMDNMFKSVREDETSKLGFVSRYSDYSTGAQKQQITKHMKNVHDCQDSQVFGICGHQNNTSPFRCNSEAKSGGREDNKKGQPEPQESGNLTVRTGKESRRRKKKKRSAGGAGLLEVSSSQSGNSTPSSPLSPLTSFTPKQTMPSPEVEHVVSGISSVDVADKRNKKGKPLLAADIPKVLDSKVSAKYKRSSSFLQDPPDTPVPRKSTSKPALLPSATFPSMSRRLPGLVNASPLHTSTYSINLCDRAPGSNLCRGPSAKTEEKPKEIDKFAYDIWGDHFFGFHLGGNNEVSSIITNASLSGDSQSFFARGPQILMQKSQVRSVSPIHKLGQSSVTCPLLQNG
ncbi:hypothetical protein MKW98_025673 [Papaver atlanticum]|uniref:TMEM131L fifth Ig-like domain-containing protein n=1 Tax=Papaver atlanticum TaxID=357466 RepID=A0AAD4SCA9_9MAGN|nr:hypothetical protein MKW98_025673 [Papaver atlanticum]